MGRRSRGALVGHVGDVAVDERVADQKAHVLVVARCFVLNADPRRTRKPGHPRQQLPVLANVGAQFRSGCNDSTAAPTPPTDSLTTMPARIDFITITLSTQDVTLDWETRRALLANLALGQQDVSRAIRKAFDDDVYASRPVTLTLDEKTYLLKVLEQWSLDTVGGYDSLHTELFTLRNALHDDLHDTPQPGE